MAPPKIGGFWIVCLIAGDKEDTPVVQHEFIFYSFGDFLGRRHAAFPGKIIPILFALHASPTSLLSAAPLSSS